MSHELFVIRKKEGLGKEEQTRATYLRDKLLTAEFLGLKAQAASLRADIAAIERGHLIATPALSDAELIIWRAWLPTAYADNGDKKHKLADYNFDRIPDPVLKMWKNHKESGAFERFEIWTPERQEMDPILVGVNGNIRHLLARWGESDANLVSFDDIKRELARRWRKGEPIGNESFNERWARLGRGEGALLSALGSFVLALVLVTLGLALITSPTISMFGGLFAGFAVSVVVYRYTRRREMDKLLQSSKLMQAIAGDGSIRRELLTESV